MKHFEIITLLVMLFTSLVVSARGEHFFTQSGQRESLTVSDTLISIKLIESKMPLDSLYSAESAIVA
jgi:hypothetical protein